MTNRKFQVGVLALLAVLLGINLAVMASPPQPRVSNTHASPAALVASVYSGSAPGANTDILAADVEPQIRGSVFRVTVCLSTESVFNVTTTDGTTAYTNGLNSSTALNAGDVYMFAFGTREDIDYNFQVETDSVIRFLYVEEVIGEGL